MNLHQNKHQNKNKQHVPVLLNEVLEVLSPVRGDRYLDLTAGYGGHAQEILARTGSLTNSTLVDRDEYAQSQLRELFGAQDIDLRHTDFLSAAKALVAEGRQYELILADLGVSSPHLDVDQRGFSLKGTGPLDMRMDQTQAVTAGTILNSYSESDIAHILKKYGEEPRAKHIAELIVMNRPLKSTDELAAIASKVWPEYSRTHPATRTFQAIRIAVNNEIGLLEESLPIWFQLLAPGGRIAIISFHSLEDRLVKQAFKAYGGKRYDADLTILTKRPITASQSETVFNPRARSAKLRAAVKK